MIHRFIDQIVEGSPPFSAFEGSSGDGDVNIYRRHDEDAAGDATRYTNYNDGGATTDGMHNPVLAPDESRIAYTQASRATGFGEIWVVSNSPGSTPVQLVSDSTRWLMYPMWSPDSSTIVFSRGNAAGNIYGGTIETVSVGGGTPTVLYTPAANYRAYRPAYNSDGTRIAFMLSHETGADDGLWIMDADGTNATKVASITAYRLDGSQFGWSPFADRLVYDTGALAADIRLINGDGTGDTKINLGDPNGAGNRVGKFPWLDATGVVIASNQGDTFWRLYRLEDDGVTNGTVLSFAHGSANQAWMKQPLVYNDRIWFIEVASGASGGMLSSFALDGSDYTEHLDVNDATLLDDFSGGTGFEWQ